MEFNHELNDDDDHDDDGDALSSTWTLVLGLVRFLERDMEQIYGTRVDGAGDACRIK